VRKASLGTIFFTVFLDLVGFGLVIPYLPAVARVHGASDFVATLLGASYSLMQLLFVPFWGRLSDQTGRRPVLLWSIAASAVGMFLLGNATSLWMLFAARVWNGIATSNIAVAQAYIADVTPPEERSKGMGIIGASIGLGFVLGPVIGGVLEAHSPLARRGALPAFVAAGLSAINLLLAMRLLPESLPKERRGTSADGAAVAVAAPRKASRMLASPLSLERFRRASAVPGVTLALVVNFVIVLSFSGLEQTFRLFTEDEFGMTDHAAGYLLGMMGMVLVVVQAGLLRKLGRLASDRTLVRIGLVVQTIAFASFALSPRFGALAMTVLYAATCAIAFGSALVNPSLSAFVSKCADEQSQGMILGVLQSAGALARVCGPAVGGLLYQLAGPPAPYLAAALGMGIAGLFSLGLRPPRREASGRAAVAPAGTGTAPGEIV
jgi:MFS family permease